MLKFERVLTEEAFKAWEGFADSFGHKHNPTMPIVTISRDNYMLGYYHVLTSPVIIPAFHPKVCTPRDFRESVDAIAHSTCIASMSAQYPNGVCFAALDKDSAIDKEIIEKLGFTDTGKTIWRRVP